MLKIISAACTVPFFSMTASNQKGIGGVFFQALLFIFRVTCCRSMNYSDRFSADSK